MIYSKFKKFTLCSMVSLIAGHAYAHTIVRDAVTEGKASYNGFVITHGCDSASEGSPFQEPYPVLGQSAIFPMMDTAVWRKNGKKIIGSDGSKTITAGTTLKLGVAGLASFSSAFRVTQEIVDKLGNVRALHWKKGGLEPKLNTVTPFQVTAPIIADNCVKSLIVRIGVINWCDVNKNEGSDAGGPYLQPKDAFGDPIPRVTGFDNNGIQRNVSGAKFYTKLDKGNGDNNRADWWFPAPDGGSKLYNDPDLLQQASATTPITVASPAFWTTLVINNSAADTAKCKTKLVNVTVEPSGADFDTYLTGPNTQPFTRGTSNF